MTQTSLVSVRARVEPEWNGPVGNRRTGSTRRVSPLSRTRGVLETGEDVSHEWFHGFTVVVSGASRRPSEVGSVGWERSTRVL